MPLIEKIDWETDPGRLDGVRMIRESDLEVDRRRKKQATQTSQARVAGEKEVEMSDRALAPGEFPWPNQIEWPTLPGPRVRAAILCYDVIEERAGGISPFRVLDRLVIRGGPLPPQFPLSFPVSLYVSLDGVPDNDDSPAIDLSIACPLGPQVLNEHVDVRPVGPYRKAEINLRVPFPIVMPGTHAIALLYAGRVLTIFRVNVEVVEDEEGARGSSPIFAAWEIRRQGRRPEEDDH